MVAGLKFLSKKAFNPQNLSNQKVVWERRQEKEKEAKQATDREAQLKRERDDEELARARGGDRGGNQAALRFMYAPPPGLAGPASDNNISEQATPSGESGMPEVASVDLKQRQPGDDEAAAEFRRMLAAATSAGGPTKEAIGDSTSGASISLSGAALSGTNVEAVVSGKGNKNTLTALEKAVGRKDANASLSLEEQIARFPQLRNAPMAKGMNSTNVGVTFKPLGTQLRNVRCLACGVWGHSRGDRECAKSGWNPFASAAAGTGSVAASTSSIRPTASEKSETSTQKELSVIEKRQKRERYSRDSSSSSSDSEDSHRKRKRSRKHKRSRRDSSRRRRRTRSRSPEDRYRHRRSSQKGSRKSRQQSSRDE